MRTSPAQLHPTALVWPVLPGTLKRGDIEGLLIDLRTALRLSPARLDALLAMIRKTRPSDWTDPNADAVCFVQQQQLAMDLGKSSRALRYDEAALVKLGFISRETIGNGRRCAPAVASPEKYGLSFSPLIRQVPHLLELRDLWQRETVRLRALRLACLALRQQFRQVLSEVREVAPRDTAVQELEEICGSWPDRMDGNWTAESLEAHRVAVAEALRRAEQICALRRDSSGEPEAGFRSHIQDTTERTPESCSCLEGKHVVPPAESNPWSNTSPDMGFLKPAQLRALASEEMRLWLDCLRKDRREPDRADFIEAAARRVPELGINDSAWDEALAEMGPLRAALSVLIIDANRDHPATPVRSPGGLLRTFIRLQRAGRLNLSGSLIGLAARKRDSEPAAGPDPSGFPCRRRSRNH